MLSLPAGTYHLRFTGTPAGTTQFYDHQARIGSATDVELAPGGTATASTDLTGAIAP